MKVMIVLMALMLGACSSANVQEFGDALFKQKPVYETKNTYTDPETPQGKTSVMQCQMAQSQCEQMAEMKQEMCVNKKERVRTTCQATPGNYCPDQSGECIENKSNCEKQYNRCFQASGGKVQSETVCVANCEEIKK